MLEQKNSGTESEKVRDSGKRPRVILIAGSINLVSDPGVGPSYKKSDRVTLIGNSQGFTATAVMAMSISDRMDLILFLAPGWQL